MFGFTTLLFTLFALFSCALTAPIEKRTTHTGKGTFFAPGLGNCGWTNSENDLIVAMSKEFYDANDGANCGQKLSITWGGVTETATMVDSCPGCSYGDLDMSPALFRKFAEESVGVLDSLTWNFIAKSND